MDMPDDMYRWICRHMHGSTKGLPMTENDENITGSTPGEPQRPLAFWLRAASRAARTQFVQAARAGEDAPDAASEAIDARIAGAVSPADYATTTATLETIARELGWDESAPWAAHGHHGHEGHRRHGGHDGHRGHGGRGFGRGFRHGFGSGFGSGFSAGFEDGAARCEDAGARTRFGHGGHCDHFGHGDHGFGHGDHGFGPRFRHGFGSGYAAG
jgi:hypothetical protein